MKKKIIKIAVSVIVLLISCSLMLAVYLNTHNLFVMLENIGIFRDEIELDQVSEPDGSARYSIDDIISMDNVTFDQSLMLINTEYILSDDFVPDIAEYKSTDVYMSKSMLSAYASLSADISEKFGTKLYVSSDFRSAEEQSELYAADPNTATLPGASEHQSGLALDVYVAKYAGDGFIKSPAGRFVNAYCHNYGFIIRYPSYGEDVTKIRFEPWHIRYVGQPHARIIYENQLTLEEYILSLNIGEWYSAEGYMISRQSTAEGLMLPKNFESCVISPDNTGCYIVTVKIK
jgi:D-alanyl-D-alanine carboxypeptidase